MPSYSVRFLNRSKIADAPPVPAYWRPKSYGDCANLPRPCPFVGCKYHLFLDEGHAGNLKTQNRELGELPSTCALDVAAEGGKTRKEVSAMLGVLPERIRQIEEGALTRLMRYVNRKDLFKFLSRDPEPGRNVAGLARYETVQSEASDDYKQVG